MIRNIAFAAIVFLCGSCYLTDQESDERDRSNMQDSALRILKVIDNNYIGSKRNYMSNAFTFGVWLQGASEVYQGMPVAQYYKNIGINTYIGLWNWPTQLGLEEMTALKNAGMKVYAGADASAVNWIKAYPEFNDTFAGYMYDDEPDMYRWNSSTKHPLNWKAAADAFRLLDGTRPVYVNFGKAVAEDEIYGSEPGYTGSKAGDLSAYMEPVDVLSSDFYGITDPWEVPSNHGIWTYGRAIRNTIKWAKYQSAIDGRNRTVFGFVETSAPWKDASSTNWISQRMKAEWLWPIAWNMVINGAKGIIYFMHDFSPTPLGNDYAGLKEPGMPAAMKAVNESVISFEKVLNTPDIAGTSTTNNGAINVITLTKQFENSIYVFAQGDGNSAHIMGQSVDAVITVAGQTETKDITVLNENRTVKMTNGKINDHFEPYAVHIYKIDSGKISKIDNTTYTTVPLGEVKPNLVIGGTDPAKFVPNINMSFGFGGAEEFFINLNNKAKVITTQAAALADDKISQTVNGETDEFYIDANGRLKWDTVFTSLPAQMEIDYDLSHSSGIEFLYQDTLEKDWQNKIDLDYANQPLVDYLSKRNRPPEIIGSYAIWCNKINNKYRTGKLCHIPRPHVIDADGKTEWCKLKINSNYLKITLPKAFMESAVYPVRLDPALGYNSIGGSSSDRSAVSIHRACNYLDTISENGTLSKVFIYGKSNGAGSVTIHLGVNLDDGTYPHGYPGTAANIDCVLTGTTPAWYSVDAPAESLTSGNKYHAAWESMTTAWTAYYDSGAAGNGYYESVGSDEFLVIALTTSSSTRYSNYIEYTAAAGGSTESASHAENYHRLRVA